MKLYEYEHYNGYENIEKLNHLDDEGIEIAKMIKRELGDVKIEYFSDAKMISTML
ncbi:MAG TPA: hypothetical protein VL098_09535 [Flavipsychrobacter sp.]|nr:hypothetical protein [Flavipsychrobacter sp.]